MVTASILSTANPDSSASMPEISPTSVREQQTETSSRHPNAPPLQAADIVKRYRSRWHLLVVAWFWRALQCLGTALHMRPEPAPPQPAFFKTIPSTLSGSDSSQIRLHFYLPASYDSSSARTFPAVVNFHGGGFALGNATDDARFARVVLDVCHALFISVDYRRAPEHAFPAAVDDCTDALLHVIRNAAALHIDPHRLATSGFSAGGNLALTALLRLAAHRTTLSDHDQSLPDHTVTAAAAWYPILDYTLTREHRRALSARPHQTLPPVLTNLFDEGYLWPPDLDVTNPFLSPSQASDVSLAEALPPTVLLYTCEWDMLLREGEALAERLAMAPIGKRVWYTMIPGTEHAWDKHPSLHKLAVDPDGFYRECCLKLKDSFGSE